MFEEVAKILGIWVSQYLAVFCLATLVLMAGGRYLWVKSPDSRVRDLIMYLASISVLALVLAFSPSHTDTLLWPPVIWFCFTMLLMMELLWIAFLVEALVRMVMGIPGWLTQRTAPEPPDHPNGTPYSRSM